ncbi:MAG TPA: adenylate/guanylate cyclase domain-containing protein [Bryobacteraceae bacterium]|nr:adenylate/guanylate cyclase domain-containing protein [Bryobacteraceae bacterium]
MPNPGNPPGAEFLERKLATILSADVAEFSRLMAENEEDTLRTFRSHKQVFESLVAMHRGRIFNTAGDAILAEFGSAVAAVRCATDIQAALRTANDQLPPNRQVKFRIGINLGDVMLHGEDLLGDGVNVAARLQTAAEAGGICVSGSVHDQIVDKLSLSFHSLGEMNFKNIPRPVRTFSIGEVEGGVPLPVRKADRGAPGGRRWMIAVAILVAGGLGFGLYLVTRNKPEKRTSGRDSGAAANPQVDAKQYNGKYSGPICYAETKQDPQRCYHAEGRIEDSIISSEWVMGSDKKARAIMAGRVSRSGMVKIQIETYNADDDRRLATITLAGTLRGGLIDASGSFHSGRPATLSWHKEAAH